jgi:hypothetical protein
MTDQAEDLAPAVSNATREHEPEDTARLLNPVSFFGGNHGGPDFKPHFLPADLPDPDPAELEELEPIVEVLLRESPDDADAPDESQTDESAISSTRPSEAADPVVVDSDGQPGDGDSSGPEHEPPPGNPHDPKDHALTVAEPPSGIASVTEISEASGKGKVPPA